MTMKPTNLQHATEPRAAPDPAARFRIVYQPEGVTLGNWVDSEAKPFATIDNVREADVRAFAETREDARRFEVTPLDTVTRP